MMKERQSDPKIPIPHIEQPEVYTERYDRKNAFDESISGFVKAPENIEKYNYEYCRYHWVGNGAGPVHTTYYADFYAAVSGANYIEIRNEDGSTVFGSAIPLTEELQRVKIGRIVREDTPYTFDTLKFVAKNDKGMEACVEWTEKKQVTQAKGPTARSAQPMRAESGDQWEYPLMRLIWCMTNHCNLSCRHCAFRDIHAHMTELSGPEIRSVTKDIIQLGVPDVTLSGGEILLSPYWYETARTFSQAGVNVSLITNGTLIDRDCAARIKEAGIVRVSVSIDDLQEQSDTIRGEDCYEKAAMGVKLLKAVQIPVSIVTTVNALNLNRFQKMRSAFTSLGADTWCLKPIYPVGEAARNSELWLDEQDINKVMEFCYSALDTPGLPVVPALTFEMHSEKGAAVLRYLYGENVLTDYHGSDAGIFSAQLHPDGSLVGDCLCQPSHAAGNVKERSLTEIWKDKRSFHALREFGVSRLSGYCGVCDRRDTCKGGDLNARLALGGIYAENKFCTYRNFKLYGITI